MTMTHADDGESNNVTATRVPEDERMHFLPRLFGRHMMVGEIAIYNSLDQLAPDYAGGLWEFYALSSVRPETPTI